MKSFYEYNRFDLEQDILRVWGVTELIEEFLRQHMDRTESFDEDEVFNKLNGIKEVLDLYSVRLWEGFELMIHNRHFKTQEEIENE